MGFLCSKYAIMLEHPPGIELVLCKRICLHVVKKVYAFMKLFSSDAAHTQTGVMYEVVTGTPKVRDFTMHRL